MHFRDRLHPFHLFGLFRVWRHHISQCFMMIDICKLDVIHPHQAEKPQLIMLSTYLPATPLPKQSGQSKSDSKIDVGRQMPHPIGGGAQPLRQDRQKSRGTQSCCTFIYGDPSRQQKRGLDIDAGGRRWKSFRNDMYFRTDNSS